MFPFGTGKLKYLEEIRRLALVTMCTSLWQKQGDR